MLAISDAARKAGLEYIAITGHSQAMAIANGPGIRSVMPSAESTLGTRLELVKAIDEHPDAGDAGRACRHHLVDPVPSDASDREHRHGDGSHDFGEAIEAEKGCVGRLGGRRKDGSCNQVVYWPSGRRGGHTVYRASDEKSWRGYSAHRFSRYRIVPQVNAWRAAR